MTAGEQTTEWCRVFDAELTPQAKRRLERDPEVSLLITAAIEAGWTPAALAEHVGYQIGYQQPENARALMVWRLRRAAGHDDEPGGHIGHLATDVRRGLRMGPRG